MIIGTVKRVRKRRPDGSCDVEIEMGAPPAGEPGPWGAADLVLYLLVFAIGFLLVFTSSTGCGGGEVFGATLDVVKAADEDLHASYSRELALPACLDVPEEHVKDCVREVLQCPPGAAGEACAASVASRWKATELVMTSLRAAWQGALK